MLHSLFRPDPARNKEKGSGERAEKKSAGDKANFPVGPSVTPGTFLFLSPPPVTGRKNLPLVTFGMDILGILDQGPTSGEKITREAKPTSRLTSRRKRWWKPDVPCLLSGLELAATKKKTS